MARLHFGSNREQAKPKKVVGRLRKTQLITTFGNGSIVDMPDWPVQITGKTAAQFCTNQTLKNF